MSVLEDLILEDIIPQIVAPASLSPINLSQLVSALSKTKNLIFIEEGSRFTSLSSEIIAQLTELKVDFNLLGRISNEEIIPCDKRRESSLIPSASNLASKIIGVFDGN
jgi:pyruvate/2-oxoglutarate/acetoin dehydrogenase E1 component